jgi:hypothetical protein
MMQRPTFVEIPSPARRANEFADDRGDLQLTGGILHAFSVRADRESLPRAALR